MSFQSERERERRTKTCFDSGQIDATRSDPDFPPEMTLASLAVKHKHSNVYNCVYKYTRYLPAFGCRLFRLVSPTTDSAVHTHTTRRDPKLCVCLSGTDKTRRKQSKARSRRSKTREPTTRPSNYRGKASQEIDKERESQNPTRDNAAQRKSAQHQSTQHSTAQRSKKESNHELSSTNPRTAHHCRGLPGLCIVPCRYG